MDVFDLFAKLGLDSSEYESGLQDAETKGANFGKGLQTAAKVGVAAVAAVGTAAVGAGTAIVKGAGEVASYGDNIDKMSQKLGLSYEGFQKWDYVLSQSGADINSMQTGLKTLTNKLDDAKNGSTQAQEMFAQLGISMEDLQTMSREDVFEATIYGFQNMADSTERAALANDLFGKSGQNLTPLFNETAESTKQLMQAAEDYGMVMSDDAVKASADYQDALDTLQKTFGGLKNNLLSEFMPAITGVMGGLTELFAGNYDEGVEKISDGITQAIDKISEAMPKILEVGKNILVSIGESLIQNLPEIMPALADLVMGLGQAIIENLPLIVNTGLQLILQLANSISDALPTLIPTIVEVVLQIVETLVDNADMLVDASIALITGLAVGLIQALPVLIEKAPEIVLKLVTAIIENAPKLLEAAVQLIGQLAAGIVQAIPAAIKAMLSLQQALKEKVFEWFSQAKDWGIDLIKNFVEGIKSKIGDVKNAVGNIGATIKKLIGFSEPEEGALSNFHTFAPDMMDLFASGIKSGAKKVYNEVGNVADGVYDAFQSTPALEIAGGYGTMNADSGTENAGGYDDIITAITDALMNMQLVVNVGNRPIEAMITDAQQRTTYRSGGR